MALLPVSDSTRAGVTPTPQAASAGGDSFENNGNTFLLALNTDVADKQVVAASTANAPVGTTQDPADGTVPAGSAGTILGPYPTGAFNDTDGLVQLTYPDGVTGLTLIPVKVA